MLKARKGFFPTHGRVIKVLKGREYLVECAVEGDKKMIVTADVAACFRNERGGRKAEIYEYQYQKKEVIVEISVKNSKRGQIVGFVAS